MAAHMAMAARKAGNKFMSKLKKRREGDHATSERAKADVYKFFEDAGLRGFHHAFIKEGFCTLQDIAGMNEEDITHVGVEKRGDLKKLRSGIEALKKKTQEKTASLPRKRAAMAARMAMAARKA